MKTHALPRLFLVMLLALVVSACAAPRYTGSTGAAEATPETCAPAEAHRALVALQPLYERITATRESLTRILVGPSLLISMDPDTADGEKQRLLQTLEQARRDAQALAEAGPACAGRAGRWMAVWVQQVWASFKGLALDPGERHRAALDHDLAVLRQRVQVGDIQ